ECRVDGTSGRFGVVQGLAEHHQVDGLRIDGRRLEVAEPEFEILEPVLFGLANAELDDSLGIVHCDDFFGTASEKLAKQTFACAQIGDDDRRNNAQQHLAECLPGTAGAVTAVKAASDLVEIKLRLLGTAREDALEVYL